MVTNVIGYGSGQRNHLSGVSQPSIKAASSQDCCISPRRGCCQQLFQFMLYTQQLPGGCLEKQTEEWWERRRRGVKTGPDTKRTI